MTSSIRRIEVHQETSSIRAFESTAEDAQSLRRRGLSDQHGGEVGSMRAVCQYDGDTQDAGSYCGQHRPTNPLHHPSVDGHEDRHHHIAHSPDWRRDISSNDHPSTGGTTVKIIELDALILKEPSRYNPLDIPGWLVFHGALQNKLQRDSYFTAKPFTVIFGDSTSSSKAAFRVLPAEVNNIVLPALGAYVKKKRNHPSRSATIRTELGILPPKASRNLDQLWLELKIALDIIKA